MKTILKLSSKLKYTLQNWLYFLLSTSIFHQMKNGKVIGLSVFYVYISISTFLVFFAGSYEHQKGIDFGSLHYALMWPFLIGAILFCTSWLTFRNNAPKSIQDQYWETQMARFSSPAFNFAKSLYPNANARYKILQELWMMKYGEDFKTTEKNAPLFQTHLKFTVIIGFAILGLLIGIWTA